MLSEPRPERLQVNPTLGNFEGLMKVKAHKYFSPNMQKGNIDWPHITKAVADQYDAF